MRLKKINLSGFKSFVDPTTLDLQSDIIAVVGPNGCGKSNVIDAVRWVMGESSSKQLRGESGTDVIFNGSSARKLASLATVELIFDNSAGKMSGEFLEYSEISVRRTVSRDGQSVYCLNGTRCRRRDVVDLFLGTGIGARSYAIIEQGMISKVVESKPEELRLFFEEAAGISLYKKRRHETYLRMQHTRDNLDKVAALREEKHKLLEKLKKQAAAAERYQALMQQKRVIEQDILAIKWQDLHIKLQTAQTTFSDKEQVLQKLLLEKNKVQQEVEQYRQQCDILQANFQLAKDEYYNIGQDITKAEQILLQQQSLSEKLHNELQAAIDGQSFYSKQQQVDQAELDNIVKLIVEIEPRLSQANQWLSAEEKVKIQLSADKQKWQIHWEEVNSAALKAEKAAEVEKTRQEQLEAQAKEYQHRLQILQTEESQLDLPALSELVELQNKRMAELEQEWQEIKDTVANLQANIYANNIHKEQLEAKIAELQQILQKSQGEQAALTALQQAALGQDKVNELKFLQTKQLDKANRLGQCLQVIDTWQLAVETVLGCNLEAVCVQELNTDLINQLADFTGNLSLRQSGENVTNIPAVSLADCVTAPVNLHDELSKILLAKDLATALAMRAELSIGQSVITPTAVWIGKDWIKVAADNASGHQGVVARQRRLEELQLLLENTQQQYDVQRLNLTDIKNTLETQRQQLVEVSAQEKSLSDKVRSQGKEQSATYAKQQELVKRAQAIALEITDRKNKIEVFINTIDKSKADKQVAIEAMAKLSAQKELLQQQKQEQDANDIVVTNKVAELKASLNTFNMQLQTYKTQRSSLEQALLRGKTQLDEHLQRCQDLKNEVANAKSDGNLQSSLREKLSQQQVINDKVKFLKNNLEEIQAILRTAEQALTSFESQIEQQRNQTQHQQLEAQTVKVKFDNIDEQVQACAVDVHNILTSLAKDANVNTLQLDLDKVNKKIAQLGAINLAAMHEYEQEHGECANLQVQYDDLTQAVATLESAINKIDKETRVGFKELFDQVHENFSNLFPELFGGGKACLQLIGDDLLEAGVGIMAMPPGKRNSSIHLLSGGEKALTAVALVFSIFKINPAPFCFLDEVDAPLDDANVVRFSKMIQAMSTSVQFVLITHNKVSMEIAQQLVGVTMKEPGVSRLVSVDIDKALEMALA